MADNIQPSNSPPDPAISSDNSIMTAQTAHSSSLQPSHDTASDNEAGEGPVREKLKKTSIAIIPRQTDPYASIDNGEERFQSDLGAPPQPDLSCSGQASETNVEGRGRLLRKRSFENSGADKETQTDAVATPNHTSEGRQRKRSKDVHAGRVPQVDTQEHVSPRSPVPEEVEEANDKSETPVSSNLPAAQTEKGAGQRPAMEEIADQEMSDHLFSPRKKRSRDPLDADPDREQKIVATEEARAHRRSEEYERGGNLPGINKDEQMNGTLIEGTAPENVKRLSIKEKTQGVGFANTFSTSPFASSTRPKSPPEASTNPKDLSSNPHMSPTSSAKKSFANFSGSSASPFGSLGSPPKGPPRPLGTVKAEKSAIHTKSSETSFSLGKGLGVLTSSTTSNSGVMAPSPFGSVGTAIMGPSFAGTTFGSSFSNSNLSGPKLTSFAAPGADTKWGGTGTVKPFGAPAAREGDGEDSDSNDEEGGEGPAESESEGRETDSRFQQQDVDTGEEGELSMFTTNRANLFAFEDGTWKERGRGVFKLNVATAHSDEPNVSHKKGRFIMRAHQTYRVLLNTPVFKQMQIGDSKGKEPPGKQLSLAVIEGGKPTPYLVRLSDDNEAKTLYREIRRLQEDL